jgi:hypothetical protein
MGSRGDRISMMHRVSRVGKLGRVSRVSRVSSIRTSSQQGSLDAHVQPALNLHASSQQESVCPGVRRKSDKRN